MSGQAIEYKPTIRCDFCGKVQGEVEFLFAAPDGMNHVCDGCVENMARTLMMARVERSKG